MNEKQQQFWKKTNPRNKPKLQKKEENSPEARNSCSTNWKKKILLRVMNLDQRCGLIVILMSPNFLKLNQAMKNKKTQEQQC